MHRIDTACLPIFKHKLIFIGVDGDHVSALRFAEKVLDHIVYPAPERRYLGSHRTCDRHFSDRDQHAAIGNVVNRVDHAIRDHLADKVANAAFIR